MSDNFPKPDAATVEAWLAGELGEDEVVLVEGYLEENPGEFGGVGDEVVALGPVSREEDPELTQLIDLVKTKHAPRLPAPGADAWREVLVPCDVDGVLGMLGEYEVVEVIATGGMGILLKARDPELRRVVALKVLSPELATNATARERFLREARAAAKLEHENILPIYGVHPEAVPYFSMRYVAGGSLQDALDGGRSFSVDELKLIARQTALALGAAHGAGIVHRDIKPANILLEDGCEKLWVCDFGIARSVEDPSLTYAGGVAGTPQYMSPEQAEGGELDGRSDLFSLGAVLYRCATGANAFAGETTASVLKNVSETEPARATQLDRGVPGWFERLLSNLLAKDPSDRVASADGVVRAVDDEHAPRPKYRVRRQRRLLALAGVVVLAMGLLQVPGVRNWISGLLVAGSDRVLTIDGRIGAYRTLVDAVDAARADDVIKVHGDGRVTINAVKIPEGKPLTLRCAEGASPLMVVDLEVGGISAFDRVIIEGLDFLDRKPVFSSAGMLALQGRGNRITDCRFRAKNPVRGEALVRRPRAVSLRQGAEAIFERCSFDLEEVNGFLITDRRSVDEEGEPISLTLIESTVVAKRCVDITNVDSGQPVLLRFERSLFVAEALVHDFWNRDLPDLEMDVEACTLALTGVCLWLPLETAEVVGARVVWRGVDNLYRAGVDFVHTGRGSASSKAGGPRVTSIRDWKKIGATEARGWKELEFPVTGDAARLWELLREGSGGHPAVEALGKLHGVPD